jgi:hypothetical protein
MKIITVLITAAGVVSLFLAPLTKFVGHKIGTASPAGYLNCATALFMLALVVMVFDKQYCSKEKS